MRLRDNEVLYSVDVSDVCSVVESEGLRALSDDQIRKVADRMGDYIDWYDAILFAIKDVVPDACLTKETE